VTATLAPWLKFAVCAVLIGVAGPILTHYADTIARLTGLSRSWVGLILLAGATSLPELFTGVSAVTAALAPNIAIGNALGACIFNLTMLVLLDVMSRHEPVYRYIDQGHILTAGFGVILIGFVGALLIVGRDGLDFRFLHVSAYTPIIVVLYLVAIRAAYVYERRSAVPPVPGLPDEKITLRTAIVRYLLAATVVAGAGIWLPFVALEIAETMGWRATFVGTLFVAAVTTLPEMVVTISAFRLGAADMAIANLLGSNLFNMFIVAIDDIAYTGGPLLSAASPTHAVSAFAAVIMSGIFIVALLFRPETRFRGTIGWVSLSLLMVYVLTAYAIYLHGH